MSDNRDRYSRVWTLLKYNEKIKRKIERKNKFNRLIELDQKSL